MYTIWDLLHKNAGTFSPSDVPVSATGSTNVYIGLKSEQLAAAIFSIFESDLEKAKSYQPGDKLVGAGKELKVPPPSPIFEDNGLGMNARSRDNPLRSTITIMQQHAKENGQLGAK